MRYQALGGMSRNGEARAELGEGRIDEWLMRWGRTAEAELGAPMATAVLCARGARAREREKRSRWVQMAAEEEAGAAGRSWCPTRARLGRCMHATRWLSSAGLPRRHRAAVHTWTQAWALAWGGG